MAQPDELSNREKEVLDQLLEGKGNKQIASALHITESTVEFHLKNIYAKCGVSSRTELILKLGQSTVAGKGDVVENRDRLSLSLKNWAARLKDVISYNMKELGMSEMANSTTRGAVDPTTFFGAIRVCLTKYADFQGRASRPEFWWFALFIILVAGAFAVLNEYISEFFLVVVLLPFLAAGTRRLRDSGQSPWLQLYLLVPVAGIFVVGYYWALAPVNPQPEE